LKPEERYKILKEVFENINVEDISILTGSNGAGKSVIRTQMPFLVSKHFKLKKDSSELKGLVASTSQALRTGSNPDWGALSGMMRDTSWMPTSLETIRLIKGVVEAAKESKTCKLVVIDEPEIGMGLETQYALCDWLNPQLVELKNKKIGVLIITHSHEIVKRLKFDNFYNLDNYKTSEEWLNREIKPIDLEELEKNELFKIIANNSKKK